MSSLSSVAVAAVAIAVASFCALHIADIVVDAIRDARRRAEIEKTQKELKNEILNGGNLARICALKLRLSQLQRA